MNCNHTDKGSVCSIHGKKKCPSVKSSKTVNEIAKKHRLEVSFIENQLKMGIPIEHEHTGDNNLARNIALQHLDEIPDYYTRLKKMETSAKKEHKNFKDVKEEMDEQRYCSLCDKRESRSECSYGEKAWDKFSVKDHEYSMARSELSTMADAIKRLQKKISKGEGNLEAWVQSKITKAADYIDTAADYIASGEMEESFTINPEAHKVAAKRRKIEALTTSPNPNEADVAKRKLGKTTTLPTIKKEEKLVAKILAELEEEKKGLWANIRAKRSRGEKPAKPGEKGYPKTLDIEEDLAQARKNVGASKCWPGKVAKGTKMKGGKEVPNSVSSENVTIEDANGNTFAEVVDIIKPELIKGFKQQVSEATRLPATTGNIISVILNWRGKTYITKMFFPQLSIPSRMDVEYEIQKVYPDSRILSYKVTEFVPGQPLIYVDNKKSKNYLMNNKTIGEETIEEEGPVLSVGRGEKLSVERGGGLTKKGRDKYNRATGAHLQAPVTGDVKPGSKAAQRRKNFCSRSRSWDGERGLAARRRWKC